MLLFERILGAVSRHPAHAAFIAQGNVVTHRQMLALVSNTARLLHDKGVRPGDVVGLAMGQSPLHLVAFLALARLGAVALPQYSNLPLAQRVEPLHRFHARWVVSESADPGAGAIPVIALPGLYARGDESDFSFTDFEPSPQSPLRIALTSGTTGAQKGFLHTHGEFVTRLDRRFYGDTRHPRAIPPMLHITASLQLACHAICRGGAVVFPHGNDARAFLAAVHLHAVTHVKLPPADLAALLSLLPEDTPAFASIEHLRIIGATPAAELVELACRKFSPRVASCYALSEVGVVAMADPETMARAPGSAGRIAPGARVEAIDDAGRVLGVGERGDLRIAVEGMPRGYYGGDAGLPGFRDGWFHPGDRGHVTADGFVYIEGRRDSLMNVGGHKVAPEFMEAVLCAHPQVGDAAVFALDDPIAGARVVAAIVARGALDWKRLADHARESLGVSAPSQWFGVAKLPRNATGKLERRELRAWVEARGKPVAID